MAELTVGDLGKAAKMAVKLSRSDFGSLIWIIRGCYIAPQHLVTI
jgi:hypothetical protein